LDNQPKYINELVSLLSQNGVLTIISLTLFNDALKTTNLFLYHLDDTHGNSKGVNLVANELIEK
jgi:hypothetical protein